MASASVYPLGGSIWRLTPETTPAIAEPAYPNGVPDGEDWRTQLKRGGLSEPQGMEVLAATRIRTTAIPADQGAPRDGSVGEPDADLPASPLSHARW
jgi:hypothetical protein